MNQQVTEQVIKLGDNDLAMTAMRERRDEILNHIAAVEDAGGQLPEQEFKTLVGELFDLNVALGDAFPDADRDGAQ